MRLTVLLAALVAALPAASKSLPPTSLPADHHDQARPNDARKTASRPLWLRGRSSCSPISDPAQSALDVAGMPSTTRTRTRSWSALFHAGG